MSLINDALKKAQTLQVRTPGANASFPRATQPAAPTPAAAPNDPLGAQSPAPTIPRPKTKSSQAGLVIAIASVVLVVGLGAIGYVVYALFFMSTPADTIAPAAAAPKPAPAPAEVRPAVTPTPDSTPSPAAPAVDSTAASAAPAAAVPTVATPVAPATPTPASTPAATSDSAAATTPAPAVMAAAPEPAAAPVEEAEPSVPERINNPDPRISAWVAGITVTGIRGGDRPKALMNDRVFLEGDTVNHELALRLTKIETRLLIFEDAEGNTYEYHF